MAGLEHACGEFNQSGFARAVATHDGNPLTGFNGGTDFKQTGDGGIGVIETNARPHNLTQFLDFNSSVCFPFQFHRLHQLVQMTVGGSGVVQAAKEAGDHRQWSQGP